MRNCARLALIVIVIFGAIGVVMAAVPELLNFQAILLEADGTVVPNAAYDLIFRIYADSVGGAPVWEESQTLTTDVGLFNTFLGNITPIPATVFAEPNRWMEMQLAENPEPYHPRNRIASVAYAYRVSTVDGATGGTITGDVTLQSTFFAEEIELGDAATSGELMVFQQGATDPVLQATHNTAGGSLRAFDNLGGESGRLEADADGDGGYISVARSGGVSGFIVDGNSGGSGEPQVAIVGSVENAIFDMGQSGDPSVSLPANAIASPEVMDEPGLAQGVNAGDVDVTGAASMLDIVVCTLTIPASGYIVVEASSQARLYSASLFSSNYMKCQIDETAGGGADPDHSYRVGVASVPNIGVTWWPVAMRRTYYKADAGEYVFRFEALDGSNEGQKFMWNPILTATYYPTAYGTVSSYVPAAAAGQFPSATLRTVTGDNVENPQATRESYHVDLRDLEARVKSLRALLLEAETELIQAEAEAQIEAGEEY